MKFRKFIKNARGISMLESLTVAAIMLVLGAAAVPRILRTYQHHQLSSTSRNLAATLQAARFVAILRQGVYGVQINNTNHTFEVVGWNATSNAWQSLATKDLGLTNGYDTFASRKPFSARVTITATGLGTTNVIAFNAKGELMNSSGSSPSSYTSGTSVPMITLTAPAGSRDLILTRFGNIKLMQHGGTTQM